MVILLILILFYLNNISPGSTRGFLYLAVRYKFNDVNNIINQNNTFEANKGNATKHPRCLYDSSLDDFLNANGDEVFGRIVKAYHGVDQTNTNEAWEHEIVFLQNALLPWKSENAHIAFEYDIPRLGKRIDVVLMLRGIIFCLEFKVGKNIVLQADVEQVLDYALDFEELFIIIVRIGSLCLS
jgi:hypothetical protein